MAKKTLAKRQRLSYRIEPSQKALKPRNPFAIPAKQRSAGTHQKSVSAQRHNQKRALKKILDDSGDEKYADASGMNANNQPTTNQRRAVQRCCGTSCGGAAEG